MRSPLLLLSSLSLAAFALSGCGVGPVVHSVDGALAIQGTVHGGQQPVNGAAMQLYTAGTSGNGSAAQAMLTTPVATAADGSFSINGDYTCASSEDQVYIVATGGNPGLTVGTNNPALVMMDPLGRCGDLSSASFISINEITTAASAYALAQFMTDATHVGASATNALGLKNAFLDAKLLVNPSTGTVATLPANLSVEQNKLYALADALAPCVNSTGGAGCAPLFTAATVGTAAAPANVLTAALNVVKNPANHVSGVFNCLGPQPPFPTAYTQAPNDWTMSLTVTGGGLSYPTALGVDAAGNVWVAGYFGVLSGFSPQGTPISASGFGAGYLSESYGMTVDRDNNVWVSNQELPSHSPGHGSLVKFQGAGGAAPGAVMMVGGSAFVYDNNTTDYPTALASSSSGSIVVANFANSSASLFSTSGSLVATSLASGVAAFPVSVAADLSDGVWLANQGDTTVTHVDSGGNVTAHPSCCAGANGVALDAFQNAWIANYYGGKLVAISNAGAQLTLVDGGQDGGLGGGYPNDVVIDAAQNAWATDYRGTAISGVAGFGGALAPGTAISPARGFGLDAQLLLPFSLAPDASGNLWVANNGNNDLVMFFGLVAPTATPRLTIPVAP